MVVKKIKNFFQLESASGIILIITAILAMVLNNTAFHESYQSIVKFHLDINFLGFSSNIGLVHFVNDFLMVAFFLLVGLEIRRELSVGELSSLNQAILPVVAAIGGMIVPVLFFLSVNHSHPENIPGWAIPSATDIAFALAILNLFGSRVPTSLKIFLTALAIIDDLGAILIIAIFYSSGLSTFWLIAAAILCILMYLTRRSLSISGWFYVLMGLLIWFAVFNSGIHATIAGVVIAMLLPVRFGGKVEHKLHPISAYFILPVFAFLNSGVDLSLSELARVSEALPLGIILGLFIGKQIGIFGAVYIFCRTKIAGLPSGANYLQMYGVTALAGVGFTMSLFIGGLAFSDAEQMQLVRLGVICGSLFSGIWGSAMIWQASKLRKRSIK